MVKQEMFRDYFPVLLFFFFFFQANILPADTFTRETETKTDRQKETDRQTHRQRQGQREEEVSLQHVTMCLDIGYQAE